jgi:hypothetical protein
MGILWASCESQPSELNASDVAVSNQQQRRQQAGGTSPSQLTIADIVSAAMVRIVAAKESSGFPAESVQLIAPTLTGQSNRAGAFPRGGPSATFFVKPGRGLDIRNKRTSYFSNSILAEFLSRIPSIWRIIFGIWQNLIDRSVKHLLFYWHFRIVI